MKEELKKKERKKVHTEGKLLMKCFRREYIFFTGALKMAIIFCQQLIATLKQEKGRNHHYKSY